MKNILLFVLCVILSEVTPQTLDDIPSSQAPRIIQKPKPSSTNTEWEELLPQLQMIKNTSKIKKDKLHNVIKIVKYLLSEGTDEQDNITAKILEEIKEPAVLEEYPVLPEMPDFESIVEERMQPIKEVTDDRTYMLDAKAANDTVKNKTADYSKILTRIAAALAKLKEQNQSGEKQTPSMMPIFRPKNGCKKDFSSPMQLGNSKSSASLFDIPCQRASDILEETLSYPLPIEALCDNPNVNLNSLAKNTKLNLGNLPFKEIVPNSVSCVDSDDSIAILFKPKTISLMQVYGNLLKKITITVLVPYYVSKLAL